LHDHPHVLGHPLHQLVTPVWGPADGDELTATAPGIDQRSPQTQGLIRVVVVNLADHLLGLVQGIADIREYPAQVTTTRRLPGEHVVLLDDR
jgi:hypothetical protein